MPEIIHPAISLQGQRFMHMIPLYTFLLSFLCPYCKQAGTFDLSVHVSNIKSASAPVRIAVYNNAGKFPSDNSYLLAKVFIPGKTGDAVFVVPGLEEGEYAVAIFQDLDNNSKLNTNFFGYPKEPFCFSNNVKPHFYAPSFRECKVALSKTEKDIYVKLID